VPVPQLFDEVLDAIARCADALGDARRLRDELFVLRRSADPRARGATVLFDLELVRLGDVRARAELPERCDALLALWRSGEGEALAAAHPGLEVPWARACSWLLAFERQGFEGALHDCWEARQDPAALARAILRLAPEGERRVEFARCLYHLELARQAVDSSRAEFARRAGLLAEAYQDQEVARGLVGADPGLAYLWQDLVPYLDEFFETLEEQAEAHLAAQALEVEDAPRTLPEVKTDPGSPPALGAEQRTVPSFRTLIGAREPAPGAPASAPPPPPPAEVEPPLAPRDTLDEDGEVILVGEELLESVAAPAEGEVVEAVEAEEPPPAPNRLTPLLPVRARLPDDGPPPEARLDAATNAFWLHTFAGLELLPGDSGRGARMLACESRADRKRLAEFIDSLAPHLQVPEARAMACLLSLMLAGQTKEKNLFGQPNPRRADALIAALPYLAPDVEAAAHVAVWFELDGPETREALGRGLQLLADYLAFCSQQRAQPLDQPSVLAFVASPRDS